MIQNAAMFQDVATVATAPAGKGTLLALHGSGKKDAFAKALQVSSSSSDEAADDKVVQNDAQAAVTAGAVKNAHLFLKRRSTGQSDPLDVEQLKGGNDGNEQSVSQPGQVKGSEGGGLGSGLQRLTAAVQQTAPATDKATDATLVTAGDGNLPTAVNAGNQQEMSGLLMLPGQNASPTAAPIDRLQEPAGPNFNGASEALQNAAQAAPKGEVTQLRVAAAAVGHEQTPRTSVSMAAEQLAPALQPAVQSTTAQVQVTAAEVSGVAADAVQTAPSRIPAATEIGQIVSANASTATDKAQNQSRFPSREAATKQYLAPAVQQPAEQVAGQAFVATAAGGPINQANPGMAVKDGKIAAVVKDVPSVTAGAGTIAADRQQATEPSSQAADKREMAPAAQPRVALAEVVQAMPKSTSAAAQGQGETPALHQEAQTVQDAVTVAASNAPQEVVAVAPGTRQSAAVAYLFPDQVRTTSKPVAVTAQSEQVVQANQGMAADKGQKTSQLSVEEQKAAPASQEAAQATVAQGPVAITGAERQQSPAAAQSEAGQIVAAAPANGPVAMDDTRQAAVILPAAEATQKEVPVAGEKANGPAVIGSIAALQPLQVESPAPDVTQSADKGAHLAADKRDPLTADGAQKPLAAGKNVAEQMSAAPKAPVEQASGTKFASADISAKVVSLAGNSAQAGSGDADKKGHSEQKAQDKVSEQLQPLGIGVQSPVVTEAAAPETKQTNLKSALHESILSQVKDGVVTHDGKGNGQMSIRLNPGELGELKIEVRMVDNRVKVEVQANNPMVKDLLMSNLADLKQALTSKNFTMEGFDVSTGGGGSNQLPEEKRSPQQQPMLWAKAGGYPGQDEGRVNYVTADVNNLLDVKF